MKGKINLYLKEKADKMGYHVVYAQIYYNNRKIRKDLCKIKKRFWNEKSQSFKPGTSKGDVNLITYNQEQIAKYKHKVENYFASIRRREIPPSFDEVRDFLLSETIPEEVLEIDFKQAFIEYIELKINANTKKTVTSVYNFLNEFEKDTGNKLSYDNISIKFYDKIKAYAFGERGISDNYLANITKYLKAFLTWSSTRDYYSGSIQGEIKKIEMPKTIIYLTMKEVDQLLNFNFNKPAHRTIRDIFCFGCHTGLRISDLQTLEHDHIKDGVITKTTIKTNVEVCIPLTEEALAILERYKENPILALPKYAEPYINRELKDICKIAGISQKIETLKHIGGKPVKKFIPKHELITMHVSRKSFITHCVRKKIPMHILRKMTGHKSDSELTKYYKIEQYQIIEEMKKWKD